MNVLNPMFSIKTEEIKEHEIESEEESNPKSSPNKGSGLKIDYGQL